MVYVPDEVDHRYLEYLAGTFATYEVVYRQLIRQQMTYVIDFQLSIMAPYLTVAEKAGFRAAAISSKPLVDAFMARELPSGYTLSDRIWDLKNYSKDIHAIIENGLRNQLSPTTIARQLDGFTLPGKSLTAPTPYGRTVSFDSMRLARTEVLEAERNTVREMARNCPWITGLYWELSANHSILCECDDYAAHGLYAEIDAPDAPHPQCQCSLVPEMLSTADWGRELSNFGDGLDILGIAGWVAGGITLYNMVDEG